MFTVGYMLMNENWEVHTSTFTGRQINDLLEYAKDVIGKALDGGFIELIRTVGAEYAICVDGKIVGLMVYMDHDMIRNAILFDLFRLDRHKAEE